MSDVIPIRLTRPASAHHTEAQVNGEAVWFESNVALRVTPEAMVSAFLVPACQAGARLDIDVPLAERFRVNIPQVLTILDEWWEWKGQAPSESGGTATPAIGSLAPRMRSSALMFSGGVDSFYSLLRGPVAPDALVMVEGFDIPLDNTARRQAALSAVEQIAAELQIQAIRLSTNLREHSYFRTVNWEKSHGGALACVGHLLRDHISHVLISSSHSYKDLDKPWGSHFRLDPLWSSDQLAVLHVGATHKRTGKLMAIAHEPLVQKYLRVCWEGESGDLNCGTCEKCVRTQLVLLSVERLHQFRTFSGSIVQLTDSVNRLPFIANRNTLRGAYNSVDLTKIPKPLADAVLALRQRSAAEHARRQRRSTAVGRLVDSGLRRLHVVP